ncbi:MAG: TolC family protein [Leeuwenhoekiella sp.]
MFRILLFIVILNLSFLISAQTEEKVTLSLEECIELALKNNLDLKSSDLNAKTSTVIFEQTRANLLPSLNANYNLGITNGRSIDPYSNDYIDQKLTFSNAGLNLDVVVFNGFKLLNSIRRDRLNMQAAEMEINEAKQTLILNVTLAYLQILNNEDLVELAQLRLETTYKQVNRLQTLNDEGEGSPADFTDIKGQNANDKSSLIDAKNALNALIFSLSQLLNVDYDIKPQEIKNIQDFEKYNLTADNIFEDALNFLPTFKAKELRVEAAKKDVNVSRSLYSPEISLFGQLNTNYSSAARLYAAAGSQQAESGGFIIIDGEQIPVLVEETQFSGSKINYNDQFNNNLNSVVGVSLNLPIFNGFLAKNTVALQKIKLEESEVDFENTKSQLKQSIKQAYSDMTAAYQKISVIQDQVNQFQESFRINEIRFNNGVSNIVAYIISKNNLDNAQISLANAKYEYLLRVKILEYYRGNI